MELKKGSVIAVCKPFAFVIASNVRESNCNVCLASSSTLKRCARCKVSYYCNSQCQRAGWEDHKPECTSFQSVHPKMPPDHVLLMARIIQKLSRGGDRERETIGNVTRTFADLQSHSREIQGDETRCEMFQCAYLVLVQFLGKKVDPQHAFEVLGKIFINTVSIMLDNMKLGSAIYLASSVLDHSCRPNVYVDFNGPELTLISLEEHKKVEDVPMTLFISYIDTMDSTAARRKQLQEQYYFHCDCPSCLSVELDETMHSLRCENTRCGEPLYRSTDKCPKCQTVLQSIRRERGRSCMKVLESMVEDTRKIRDGTIPESPAFYITLAQALANLECGLKDADHILHPLNVAYIKAAVEAFDLYIVLQQCDNPQIMAPLDKALRLGLLTLASFRHCRSLPPSMARTTISPWT